MIFLNLYKLKYCGEKTDDGNEMREPDRRDKNINIVTRNFNLNNILSVLWRVFWLYMYRATFYSTFTGRRLIYQEKRNM